MTTRVYHLQFRSPLRIGERGVGLEATRNDIPADTLFSAICSAWRLLYGATSLENDLLKSFQQAATVPFLITSAFPFAGDVRFYPKPFGIRPNINSQDEKLYKRVRYVSEKLFEAIVAGTPMSFSAQNCVNGDQVWLSAEEKKSLQTNFTDDETGALRFWKTAVVPRVTLDRVTNASQIWHMGLVQFVQEAGLWFAVQFLTDSTDIRNKLEACLRLLEDSGIGGERGAGLGLFCFVAFDKTLPSDSSSNRFVTLSPFCPRDSVELNSWACVNYELTLRRGWIGSPEGGHLRRKEVWMFAEGSVFEGNPDFAIGNLMDVTPDVFAIHRVYRYGYAFPMGVKSS